MAKKPTSTIDLGLEDVRQRIHDLRNSLYAMNIGLELLARVRNDDERFNEVSRLMSEEHRKAIAQIDAFSAAVSQREPPAI